MKLLRPLYMCIAWAVELFAFHRWFSCWLFKENFYFTSQALTTHLINDINADQGMPLLFVRVIHNKIFALLWGLSQSFLQYWDVRFLEEFISVIGAVGVGLGIWYFVTKDRKNKLLWALLALGIVLPVVHAFLQPHIEFKFIVIAFGIIFQAISLYGLWKFLEVRNLRRYVVLSVFLAVSILFLILFPLFYQNFCLKI